MFLMLSQPGVYERLQKDRSLIPNFNEEVLRYQTPIPHIYRLAKQDAEINGVPIPKGSVVMVSWLGSNRDNDKFPEALVRLDPKQGRQRDDGEHRPVNPTESGPRRVHSVNTAAASPDARNWAAALSASARSA